MLRRDRDGVVELPFKLVIAGIIVIITMSIAYAGLQRFSESSLTDRVEASVSEIVAAAGDVATMGVDSSVKVKVDLTASAFHRVESFTIGCGPDDDDIDCKGVRYRISGLSSKLTIVKDHAGYDIVIKGRNKAIVLGEGAHDVLLLKCQDHLEVSQA